LGVNGHRCRGSHRAGKPNVEGEISKVDKREFARSGIHAVKAAGKKGGEILNNDETGKMGKKNERIGNASNILNSAARGVNETNTQQPG